ncbi:MAG: MerR family transcriptional regulator [Trueperaceae bacterium]|nr:MAG: MerR family transcriptional regulator [Trueperaceae bacterium]
MTILRSLTDSQRSWTLEEFAALTNQILPDYLPGDPTNTRIKSDVNPRLIRHYTTEGLIDEPLKNGREARYDYRHLLQLLVVRRLLSQGYTASAIGTLARKRHSNELETLLEGGITVELAASNEALSFIDAIQERTGATHAAQAPPTRTIPAPQPAEEESSWTRIRLLEGLELHIRDDFKTPDTLREQQNLLDYLTLKLIYIHQRRKR